MTLLYQLQEKSDFTGTEARVSDYILQELENFSAMTIHDIGIGAYTSNASIIRLAKKLGFEGFKDFKIQLVKDIQASFTQVSAVDPNFPFDVTDNVNAISKKLSDLSIKAITETTNHINTKEIQELAKVMSKSNRIFLYGIGDSQIRINSFQNKLMKLNIYAIVADNYSEEIWHTLNAQTGDIALFVTYGGHTQSMANNLKQLRRNKVKTALITASREDQLRSYSDFVISLPKGEGDKGKISTFFSQIAIDYVLNLLFSLIYKEDFTKNAIETKKKNLAFKKLGGKK
ncbi:MurR/RpiR family transcriptional regulator [Streptococcus parauberis]|uniref:HTH-type transcriptional regulator RpiR n=2 Tax=Streptococcus parauberis TaxID=1348 RepID=A0A0E2UE03_9STRE|nr:MurR/RpiR family transcriptional regulator [Streptococcus parauberis]AEF24546.1 transcriptional regulator [Streptococcus parauberis KCTC 11537]AUT05019.1 putative HTH-type transcriptional regulator in aarA 3'region [Streptococcus parauberis]EMF48521.1 Sialic acid utilization regulator, RpiR family [Streptococcus parauberis KRS-02109]EMG25111.1 Sialic acid utilization regulator, RpiR family [Streptococcus parauberis KRS-02083]KYP19149.1 HTH-type transcriptional regulator RpiR [Streptococcus 